MILRAAAALPHADRELAMEALRRQLLVMATAAGGTPDWTTFRVAGPTHMAGAQDSTRFEWTASVAVPGAARCSAQSDGARDG